MAASLEGIFGREYKTIFDVNASQTVNCIFERFAPDVNATELLDSYGNCYTGEVIGLVMQAAHDPNSPWNQSIRPDRITPCVSYAVHEDTDLLDIMHGIDPAYKMDPYALTPGNLVAMSCIYYFGITTRLANHKRLDFIEQTKTICDPIVYQQVFNSLKATHQDFAQYLPQKPEPLIVTGEPEKVVKRVERLVQKATEEKYIPTDKTKYHRAGVFEAGKDQLRNSIGPANPDNISYTQWINGFMQVGANILAGKLRMECHNMKDQLLEGKRFPGINFTGVMPFQLTPDTDILLQNEFQYNLYSDEIGKSFSKRTESIRTPQRQSRDDQWLGAARNALNEQAVEIISPSLSEALRNRTYIHPSHEELKKCFKKEKPQKTKKSYQSEKKSILDMSKTNFLDEFVRKSETNAAFRKMIRIK